MKLQPLDAREQLLLRQVIGLRCRKAREELGLSQRALAREMERSPSWVREIESGAQYAPAYLIRALATGIGISAAWFYGEECVVDPGKLASEILQAVNERLATPTA
jgi:transcriptional regulator with XRE-family HTH domain